MKKPKAPFLLRLPLVFAAIVPLASCIIAITPTSNPSTRPSAQATLRPTPFPTPFPTAVATPFPTPFPTVAATAQPSATPSVTSSLGSGGFQLAAGCPEAPGTNLVRNAGFETPDAGSNYIVLTSAFEGWTLDANTVDVVGTLLQSAAGKQSLDLSGGNAGTLSQELATTAGQSYRLTLCLAGNPGGEPQVKLMNVMWNGSLLGQLSFDTAGKTFTSMGWVSYTVILPGSMVTGISRLSFQSLANSAYGPVIDNVSVYPVTTP